MWSLNFRLFHGYRVYFWGDKNVLEQLDGQGGRTTLKVLNATE